MAEQVSPEFRNPPKSDFLAKLEARWERGLFVCVGLDSDFRKIPQYFRDRVTARIHNEGDALLDFNTRIVDETSRLACAYKPNMAFKV